MVNRKKGHIWEWEGRRGKEWEERRVTSGRRQNREESMEIGEEREEGRWESR